MGYSYNNIWYRLANIPPKMYCKNYMCDNHHEYLQSFHDFIVKACLTASRCIPNTHKKYSKKRIPGWKTFVEPFKNDAIFWHTLWKQIGSPTSGVVFDVRKRTRYKYHQVLKKVRVHEDQICALKLAESLHSPGKRDFWTEIRKIRGNSSGIPNVCDGQSGDENIASLFHEKYERLYNSVSYNVNEMKTMKADLNCSIMDHCIEDHDKCKCVFISVSDIVKTVKGLKQGKHDGNNGHFSDHLIHGTPKLYVYMSLLFGSMITHGFVPHDLLLSTLVPIPKNKRMSLNTSDNYRAIALSSIIGKLLDKIILDKCNYAFTTCDMQFGFKQKHSTNHCTFIVNEVLQYYSNNNSTVLVTLLDASKAFDRVEYIKLFKLLLSRNLCPVVMRLLLVLYTNQLFRVKWGSVITDVTNATNGVKQGGVMSPLLFTVYIDELLCRLQQSSVGCYIGNKFCGALGYADDLILLAPTASALQCMLNVCTKYALEYNVVFNENKTKLIYYPNTQSTVRMPKIVFNGIPIKYVNHDKHLGYLIGNVSENIIISQAISEFLSKVNMVKSHFKNLPPNILYSLFKSYCMPLYGCSLWDFSGRHIDQFYTAWRKAVRYLLNLPYTTHCNLIPRICKDMPVCVQLYVRFIKFYKSLVHSNNEITKTCALLAFNGSQSSVANNITIVSQYFRVSRQDISSFRYIHVDDVNTELHAIADVVYDLLYTKYLYQYMPNDFCILTWSECNDLLNELCTN